MRGTHDRYRPRPGNPFGAGPRDRRRRGDFPGSPDIEPGDGRTGGAAAGAPSHDAGDAGRPSGADPGTPTVPGGPTNPGGPGSTGGRRGGPGRAPDVGFGPGFGAGFGGRAFEYAAEGGDPGRRGHHGRTAHGDRSGRARGGRGPGRRAGRGDVRAAVLLLLAEQPRHGYQLIQEIAARSGGRWQPSPGAVYPALNLLEDEGLVTTATESGRRLATLTDAGRAYVQEHAEELGTPWDDAATRPADPIRTLRDSVGMLVSVVHQVGRTGTDEQVARAVALLDRARRDLYLVLAGEDPAARDAGPGAS
ncbi:PadR family transcriptional regulator [Cellulomonas alba]|uniref:PadR family transcriptional regulator n=1 Tax=Cellulomonas alba TaxID=3053467 RepID=A0ABT7SFM5_9CELL|nr:PadR family transcriptional regulator [Cellulomonas alba]MDM7854839.1 PadR family transcriptional regulator [Cellulomonas alba]